MRLRRVGLNAAHLTVRLASARGERSVGAEYDLRFAEHLFGERERIRIVDDAVDADIAEDFAREAAFASMPGRVVAKPRSKRPASIGAATRREAEGDAGMALEYAVEREVACGNGYFAGIAKEVRFMPRGWPSTSSTLSSAFPVHAFDGGQFIRKHRREMRANIEVDEFGQIRHRPSLSLMEGCA
jgi:hypothetical protein